MKFFIPTLEQVFEKLPITKNYYSYHGLRDLAKMLKIKIKEGCEKNEIIPCLVRFYQKNFSAQETFEKLSPPEKALATHLVRSKGLIDYKEFMKIVKDYQWERCTGFSSFSIYAEVSFSAYIKEDNLFWILFPSACVTEEVHKALIKVIGNTPRGEPLAELPDDAVLISREKRLEDFNELVKYCNKTPLLLTKANVFSKSGMVAFWKQVSYEELTDKLSCDATKAYTIQKMRIGLPICLAAIGTGLLATQGNKAFPGRSAALWLSKSQDEFAKRMFEGYQTTTEINEISYLSGIREWRKTIPYASARQYIVQELRNFQEEHWFSVQEFLQLIHIENRMFLRPQQDAVCCTGRTDYLCRWEEVEEPFLYLLLSVYSALGLLDLAWAMREQMLPTIYEEEYELQSIPVCFRITALGAYVFGLTDQYCPAIPLKEKLPGGFVVQPDFTLMLPESTSRLQHELYFDRFLTKCNSDAQIAIYRIDIASIIKLLNLGITVETFLEYLESGVDKPMPANVRHAFDDWIKMAGKLRIRTVTILETDDAMLLEEVIRYKGIEPLVHGRTAYGAIIDLEDAKKVKSIIEKNKRYCKDVYTR